MLSYSFGPHRVRPPLGASSPRVYELQKSILLVWRLVFNSLTFFQFSTNLCTLPVPDVPQRHEPKSLGYYITVVVGSYSSTKMQSTFSIALADWTSIFWKNFNQNLFLRKKYQKSFSLSENMESRLLTSGKMFFEQTNLYWNWSKSKPLGDEKKKKYQYYSLFIY